MTAASDWALQQAVYAVLRADAGLIALIGDGASPERAKVYDQVPPGIEPPYVTLGETTEADWSTKTKEGSEITLTIHAWSTYRGRKETKQIMAAVVDALDRTTPTVTGRTVVLLRHDFSDVFQDPDGVTWHGVVRFRALLQA